MKIISKYKDYYDHISGLYGEDPKIVLDRRDGGQKITPSIYSEGVIQLVLCGLVYDGYSKGGKFYWGEQLRELSSDVGYPYKKRQHMAYGSINELLTIESAPYLASGRVDYSVVALLSYKDSRESNLKQDCPILLSLNTHHPMLKYPKLEELGIQKLIPAQEIYLMLSAWLAPKDIEQSCLSDRDKILSKGFDLKSSFRPKIKK